MTGNYFIEGIANTDQRLMQIFRAEAIGMKQRTMGAAGSTFFYIITQHIYTLLSFGIQSCLQVYNITT
jgi:hypothetical protein